MQISCYEKMPINFQIKFFIAACILQTKKNEVLFLLRSENVSQPCTWGLPAGKIEEGELPVLAATRELKEETNIALGSRSIQTMPVVYVSYPDYDFVFYAYKVRVGGRIKVKYDTNKHKDFCWMHPIDAAKKLPLIGGLDYCLNYYLGLK